MAELRDTVAVRLDVLMTCDLEKECHSLTLYSCGASFRAVISVELILAPCRFSRTVKHKC